MTLLGIDVGTTNCKACVFTLDGGDYFPAKRPTPVTRHTDGSATIDPDALWETVSACFREAAAKSPEPVQAVGIASQAESGLFVDAKTGAARLPIVPWFDMSAQRQADAIAAASDPVEFYIRSGVRVTYKLSLAKILRLHERDRGVTDGAVWLSVADYIAFRLTGAFGTDYSLAGRTGGFDIWRKQWDADWLARWGLSPEHFPAARPSGTPVGVSLDEWQSLGIPPGTPVAVGGHDHLCAASNVGADEVFDSMGTAEVLVGAFAERQLTQVDYDSGLSSGCHVIPGLGYWMGGLSASGGTVVWLDGILPEAPKPLWTAVFPDRAGFPPTGILFFPYLLGSGAPHSDPLATGAFVGLRAGHTAKDLEHAVLEGIAYELELIRRAGEAFTSKPISRLLASGGGMHNAKLMTMKADVSNVEIDIATVAELTLRGAAMVAGIGCDLLQRANVEPLVTHMRYQPDAARHEQYRALCDRYMALEAPLRRFSSEFKGLHA